MKTTRRTFLQTSALASIAAIGPAESAASTSKLPVAHDTAALDAYAIASRHPLIRTKPGPTYFEGMLLGNGDIGVCAVVRPDALGLHISKNDCWDIRVTEGSEKDVRQFAEILEMWKRASVELKQEGHKPGDSVEDAEFFRDYIHKVGRSYSKPWPRPWPCGTVWLKWDPRWVEPASYQLNPANGIFELELKIQDLDQQPRVATITAFVDRESGRIALGSDPLSRVSVIYSPAIDGFRSGPFENGHAESHPDQLPRPALAHRTAADASDFSCFQYFPAIGPSEDNPNPPRSERDRNFALHGRIAGAWEASSIQGSESIVFSSTAAVPVRIDLAVATPRDLLLKRLEATHSQDAGPADWITIPQTQVYDEADLATPAFTDRSVAEASGVSLAELRQKSEMRWREFWSASAVRFEDDDLERIWYHNQYFLACCLRQHKTAPGLFANWSSGDIGTAWHGDYHPDYNCQQVYLGVFSSNHVQMHHPYVELWRTFAYVGEVRPRSSICPARFSLYRLIPFRARSFLIRCRLGISDFHDPMGGPESLVALSSIPRTRSTRPRLSRSALRDAISLCLRPKRGGRAISCLPVYLSENWGCTIDFKLNKDCILDLSLIRFVMDATVKASTILSEDAAERASWQQIAGESGCLSTGQGPMEKSGSILSMRLSNMSTTCPSHWRLFFRATRLE